MEAPRSNKSQNLNKAIEDTCNVQSEKAIIKQLETAYSSFKHVNTKAANADGETPIIVAARCRNLYAVKWLLNPPKLSFRQAAKLGYNSKAGDALSFAVRYQDTFDKNNISNKDNRILVRLLIQAGAHVEHEHLRIATESGNVFFLRNQLLNFYDHRAGQFLMYTALDSKNIESITHLVEYLDPEDFKKYKKEILKIFKTDPQFAEQAYDIFRVQRNAALLDQEDLKFLLPNLPLIKKLAIKYHIQIAGPLLTAIIALHSPIAITWLIENIALIPSKALSRSVIKTALKHFDFVKALIQANKITVTSEILIDAIPILSRDNLNDLLSFVDLYKMNTAAIVKTAADTHDYELVKTLLCRGAASLNLNLDQDRHNYLIPTDLRHFITAHCLINAFQDFSLHTHLLQLSSSQRKDLLKLFEGDLQKTARLKDQMKIFNDPVTPRAAQPNQGEEGVPNILSDIIEDQKEGARNFHYNEADSPSALVSPGGLPLVDVVPASAPNSLERRPSPIVESDEEKVDSSRDDSDDDAPAQPIKNVSQTGADIKTPNQSLTTRRLSHFWVGPKGVKLDNKIQKYLVLEKIPQLKKGM